MRAFTSSNIKIDALTRQEVKKYKTLQALYINLVSEAFGVG